MTAYFRYIRYTLLALLVVFVLALLLLQLPVVQTYAVKQINNSLSKKLGNHIRIKSVNINFLNNVDLNDVLIEDQAGDTLAYIKELNVTATLTGLLKKELNINHVELDGASVRLTRKANEEYFNYQFIIDAFASTDTLIDKTAEINYNINLDEIELTSTHFLLQDEATGSSINLSLGNGKVEISTFDLANNLYGLDELSLDNAAIDFIYTSDPNKQSEALAFPTLPLSLNLKDVSISDSKVAIRAKGSTPKKGSLVYQNLSLTDLQLAGQNITVDSTWINGEISQLKVKDHSGFEISDMKTNFSLDNQKIEIQQLELTTAHSSVKNKTLLTFDHFMDLEKLDRLKIKSDFDNTTISVEDLQYFVDLGSQKIFENINPSTTLLLNGNIDGDISHLEFSQISVRIPTIIDSKIHGYVNNVLDKDHLDFNLNIEELNTSSSKLSEILPTNTLPAGLDSLGNVTLVGNMAGNLSSILLSDVILDSSAKTSAQLSGTISHLLDADKLFLDINIKSLITHLDDFEGLLKGDLPPVVKKVGTIEYSGLYKGTTKDFSLDGDLSTDIGRAKTDMTIHFNKDYTDANYDGYIILDDLNLGTILNNADFETTSVSLQTNGSGLSLENFDNQVNARFSSLIYKGVGYKNFEFNGSIAQKVINGDFNIDNPFAKASFKGILDLSEEQPDMNFRLAVDTLALRPMNLSTLDIAFSGITEVVGHGKSLDEFIGSIQIGDLYLRKDSLIYKSDSLVCTSVIRGETNKELDFMTDGVKAHIIGDFTLSQLPIYIQHLVDKYIPVAWIAEQIDENGEILDDDQIFNAELHVDDERFIHLFLPKLEEMKSLQLRARVNSAADSLDIKGNIETIIYGEISTSDIVLNTKTENSKILNQLSFKELLGISKLEFPLTTIDATLQKDSLLVAVDVKKETNDNLLKLAANLHKEGDVYEVNFRDQLQLDSAIWDIATDNTIKFKSNYLDIKSLKISKQNQLLAIESEAQGMKGSAPIDIHLEEFDVHELSNLFALENDVLYGFANGTIVLDHIFSNINYSGDLLINDIIIKEDNIGDFKINAAKRNVGQIIDLDLSLLNSQNDFVGKGFIDLGSKQIELKSDFANLQLSLIDPFLIGIVSDSKGTFNGQVHIHGALEKPVINGTIKTNKLSTLIDFSQVRYEINDQVIQIDNSQFGFSNFALQDEYGKIALANGQINHDNFADFFYDLSIESKGFQFLNTTVEDNPLFYGTLYLDATAQVTGPVRLPNLEINAKSLTGSSFHLSPFIESDVISQDEYIIFIDKENGDIDSTELTLYKLTNSLPLNLSLNLTVDKETEFQFIIDPISGDRLSSFGDASLQISIPPSGNIEVVGVYTIDNGKYNFSYGEFLKKEFDLSKGGRVTFQGDPLLAQFDTDAIYNTKASPLPLLSNSGATESEISEARQRTAVQVLLNLSGSISNLALDFGLIFPDDDFNSATAVGRRVADISTDQEELYNQIFSLLLLNTFFSPESNASSLGNAAPNAALHSVSGLIEDRLNKLADNHINGIEVNIAIDSYNTNTIDSEGENTSVTEFGVGVSKKLLNDRLTLQALGNLNVDNRSGSAGFSSLAGDFIIEYKLNDKGNYAVSAFRKSDSNILQDESLDKNGIGIKYRKSLRSRKLKKVADDK